VAAGLTHARDTDALTVAVSNNESAAISPRLERSPRSRHDSGSQVMRASGTPSVADLLVGHGVSPLPLPVGTPMGGYADRAGVSGRPAVPPRLR
jgi:hypothetical protein